MKRYKITYHLLPDAEDITIDYLAKSEEDAVIYAKEYRKDAFSVREVPEYKYGMRLRGFAPLCQPKEGFVRRENDPSGIYHDLLVYDRKLKEKELDDYELDFIEIVRTDKRETSYSNKVEGFTVTAV